MKEILTAKNHARVIAYASTLAQNVEQNPTPSNIRRWRHKANAILKALDNVEEFEDGEDQ